MKRTRYLILTLILLFLSCTSNGTKSSGTRIRSREEIPSRITFNTMEIEKTSVGGKRQTWIVLGSERYPGAKMYIPEQDLNSNNSLNYKAGEKEVYLNMDGVLKGWVKLQGSYRTDRNNMFSGGALYETADGHFGRECGFAVNLVEAGLRSLPEKEPEPKQEWLFEKIFEVDARPLPVLYKMDSQPNFMGYGSDGDLLITTFDQYIALSRDRGKTWTHTLLPNTKRPDGSYRFDQYAMMVTDHIYIEGEQILITGAIDAYSSDRGKTWLFHTRDENTAFGKIPFGMDGEFRAKALFEGKILFDGKERAAIWNPSGREAPALITPPVKGRYQYYSGDYISFFADDYTSAALYNPGNEEWQIISQGTHGLKGDIRVAVRNRDTLIVGGTAGLFLSRDRGETFRAIDNGTDFPAGWHPWEVSRLAGDEIVLKLQRSRPALGNIWGVHDIEEYRERLAYISVSHDGGDTWEHKTYNVENDLDYFKHMKSSDPDGRTQLIAYMPVEREIQDRHDRTILYRPAPLDRNYPWERSLDGGNTWQRYDEEWTGLDIESDNRRHLEISTDRGKTWQEAPFHFMNGTSSQTGLEPGDIPVIEDLIFAAHNSDGNFQDDGEAGKYLDLLNRLFVQFNRRFIPDHNIDIRGDRIVLRVNDKIYLSEDLGRTFSEVDNLPFSAMQVGNLQFFRDTIMINKDYRSYYAADSTVKNWEYIREDNNRKNEAELSFTPHSSRFASTGDYVYAIYSQRSSNGFLFYPYRRNTMAYGETNPWESIGVPVRVFMDHPTFAVSGNNMAIWEYNPTIHNIHNNTVLLHLSHDGGKTWKDWNLYAMIEDPRVREYLEKADFELVPVSDGVIFGTPSGLYRIKIQ